MRTSRPLIALIVVLVLLLVGNIIYTVLRTTGQDDGRGAGQRTSQSTPVVRVINAEERLRMEQYITDYYGPLKIVQTIQLPQGELIDCVDINAQPALFRKGLEGHQVQLEPSEVPAQIREGGSQIPPGAKLPDQEYLLFGGPCPGGSVPIRHLTIDTLIRFRTLDDFFKKEPQTSRIIQPPCGDDGSSSVTHEYAHARQSVDNLGGEAVLGLWNVWVEWSNEFSLSQLWIVRGDGADRDTLEAGWQSYKDKYDDWNAHLFIYFTPDNYGSGGCYNLDCGGFVQTDNTVYIGGGFTNASSDGGDQYAIKLLIARDPGTANWWLWYSDRPIGYWPSNLFQEAGLLNQASRIDFGGEIVNTQPEGRHTNTDMGSGNWPSDGWRWAASDHNIQYVDLTYTYADPTLTEIRTDSDCYDVILTDDSGGSWGDYFYFGGPGRNGSCP